MPAESRTPSPDVGGTSKQERSGWWLCPRCGDLHDARHCPVDRAPGAARPPGLTILTGLTGRAGTLHLCACCARVPVRHASPQSSFFCDTCEPLVVEVNRTAAELVIPVCRDPRRNAVHFLPDDCAPEPGHVERATQFLTSQIEQLAESAAARARTLLHVLRRSWSGKLLPLDSYLERVSELRADKYQAPAALRDLLDSFCPYVLEVPAESPALATRIAEAARTLARDVDAGETRSLLACGPAAVREAARLWAWHVIDRVLPIPSFLPSDSCRVPERRSHTIRALIDAAVREVEAVHGPATRPTAPLRAADLQITVPNPPVPPGAGDLPDELPEGAIFVVSYECEDQEEPDDLRPYHLSSDPPHDRWILWKDLGANRVSSVAVPVAWCRQTGLPARDAAFFLLEALLARERRASDCAPSPLRTAMPGILGWDLADVLLERVRAKWRT